MFLDPRLRDTSLSKLRKETWFQDQYKHPHESKHTMGEVLKWFNETGFRFVNSIPKNQFMQSFTDEEKLFAINAPVDRLTLGAVQAHMVFTGRREGGLFIMIGQRM